MKRLSTLDVVVRRSSVGVCFLCLVSLSVPGGVEAQVRSMQFQPGGSIQVQGLNAAQAAAAKQAADAAKAAQKAAAAKGAKPPTKPGAKPGAKPATAAKGKGKTEAKIIKRGDIKIDPGDPKELEVKPIDGMIKLSFRGQKWPALLDWYSRATGTNIDWQELPNDQINLSTQREVTMEEVRDTSCSSSSAHSSPNSSSNS